MGTWPKRFGTELFLVICTVSIGCSKVYHSSTTSNSSESNKNTTSGVELPEGSGDVVQVPVTNTRVCSGHIPTPSIYSGDDEYRAQRPSFALLNVPSGLKDSKLVELEAALAEDSAVVGEVARTGTFSTGKARYGDVEAGLLYLNVKAAQMSKLKDGLVRGRSIKAIVFDRDRNQKLRVLASGEMLPANKGEVLSLRSNLYSYTRPDKGGCQGDEFEVCRDECENRVDPLVVNLQPGAIDMANFTSAGAGVKFDIQAIGLALPMAWVKASSNYAFLFRDIDGNGQIPQDGEELFATTGDGYSSGFEALLQLNNGRPILDASNPMFHQLKLWVNPRPGAGQVIDLSSLATSIDLNYLRTNTSDSKGNLILGTTSVAWRDGSSHSLADVLFSILAPH